MIQIKRAEDCCGCTACESICGKNAITMIHDSEGFLYPQIDLDRCVDCHLCESSCPIIKRKNGELKHGERNFYALRHNDKDILQKSSSGGAFSAIAEYVLEKDGLVYGAIYDGNMVVKHIAINRIDELWRLRGSKYVQSDVRGIYRDIRSRLNKGKWVLFSGTPCQVEGLKLFLRKPQEKLLTVDLVCHAAGSPLLFRDYIDYLENKYGKKVIWMNMRDKEQKGWGHQFIQRTWLENNKSVYQNNNLITWWAIYYSHMANRPSCHECKFANLNRSGDITLADFWDDKNTRPDIYSSDGTSLCIVNTEKGEKVMDFVRSKMVLWEVSVDEAWQPCLEKPTPVHPNRANFWKDYYSKGAEFTFRKYCYVSKLTRYKWWIKNHVAKAIGYAPKN